VSASGTVKAGSLQDDEDRYSITRRDGFLRFAEGPRRERPPRLTRNELEELAREDPRELARYNNQRIVWTANIGPIKTPQLTELHEDLLEIVESNRQDGNRPKPAALVDAYAGLGKTTAVLEFIREFHRAQIALRGAMTSGGQRRVPVAYIDLSGNTHIRGLNAALCRFYHLPDKGDADTLAERAKDAVLSLDTRVIAVDDIHFLAPVKTDANAVRMANQLKFLANTFPVTLIYVGVEVMARGLLAEGQPSQQALFAQFGRRTTPLTMRPFRIEDEDGRQEWHRLLKSIERQLVLADQYAGMLAEDLSDYLYARSTGHFESLMCLIARGCRRAIRSDREVLDEPLMAQVKNDAGAEAARKDLQANIKAGLVWTRPQDSLR
jgi:hypothetical protein